MAHHSKKDETEVLNYIFKECSNLNTKEQEKNINTYYAIKHHIPSELFKTKKLKFNYNKGVSYILSSYGEIQLFKIPNNNNLIEIICPPSKDYINSLDISDVAKERTIKKYKDTNCKYWYVKLTPDEVLCFSSKHWIEFNDLLKKLI